MTAVFPRAHLIILVSLYTTLAGNAAAPADRLLDAIALVESRGRHEAIGRLGERGAWQMTRGAWDETTQQLRRLHLRTHPFRFAHDPNVSRLYASKRLDYLRYILRAALGREATPAEYYAAWNVGLTGFKHRGYRVDACPKTTRRTARNVANLVGPDRPQELPHHD